MKYTHELLTESGELAYYWDEDSGNLYETNKDKPFLKVTNTKQFYNVNLTLRLVEEEN